MKISVFAVLTAAALITACATKPIATLQAVDPAIRSAMVMSNAAVRYDAELGANGGLEQDRLTEVIRSELARQISQSAENTNPRRVTVDVEIIAYREPNEALALVLGDSSQIVGNVKVLDAESGDTLGEYYIEVTEGTSGLIGLALSDTNEVGLGREFVEQFMKHLNESATS